ncbi:NnrS family protein, partial [Bordetella pertussis]
MAELLQIDEPAAARAAPQWRAFLELGFRPLYLVGAAWGALSVALWIGAPQWLGGAMAGVIWHAHEMLWGFIGAIAVGFLLTAAATWTGVNPLRGGQQ